jgi:hypothetical protein
MHAPQPLSQPDLQKWVHDHPLDVLAMMPDSPELEVAKSHIRLGYARALLLLRKQQDGC